MSKKEELGTFPQAAHTLRLLEDQKLTVAQIDTLHDGYLTDLARAVKIGTIPPRPDFQKLLGLPFETEVKTSTIVTGAPAIIKPTFQFKIWKTIVLGRHKTPATYRKALGGRQLGTYAGHILDNISVSQTEVEIDLARVTGLDVGFTSNVRRDKLYDRFIELGAEKCPAEVGPATRLQYLDQPYGECLRVMMDPLPDSDDVLNVFAVALDDYGRWLHTYYGGPAVLWSPGIRVARLGAAQVVLGFQALGS